MIKPTDVQDKTLSTRGDLFFCLLAAQQFYSRPLTEPEIMDIFLQGIKDPSIIDRQARLGNKAHLLTLHAKQILDIEWSLYPTDKKRPDVFIGSLDYTVVAFNEDFVYSSRTKEADVGKVSIITSFNWV